MNTTERTPMKVSIFEMAMQTALTIIAEAEPRLAAINAEYASVLEAQAEYRKAHPRTPVLPPHLRIPPEVTRERAELQEKLERARADFAKYRGYLEASKPT